MKLKYVFGVLALLLLMVSTASAEPFKLSYSNTDGATKYVTIWADLNGNTLTVWGEPNSTSVETVRIDKVGFNLPSDKVDNVLGHEDAADVYWVLFNKNPPYQMSGVGDYWSEYKSPGADATSVVVTFNENVESIDENDAGFEVAAHAAWTYKDGATDTASFTSAFFAGPYGEIPEFPTVALPVAAILGLLFIFGRRKQE